MARPKNSTLRARKAWVTRRETYGSKGFSKQRLSKVFGKKQSLWGKLFGSSK